MAIPTAPSTICSHGLIPARTRSKKWPENVAYDLASVSTDWQVQGVGDYNRDGFADILWRNATSGDVTAWESTTTPFNFSNKDFGVAQRRLADRSTKNFAQHLTTPDT